MNAPCQKNKRAGHNASYSKVAYRVCGGMCRAGLRQDASNRGGRDDGITQQGLQRNSLMFFDDQGSHEGITRINVCLGSKGFIRTDADRKIVIDDLGRPCCQAR